MVVYGDGKRLLRRLLPDHVLVEELLYLLRRWHRPELGHSGPVGLVRLNDDLVVYEPHAVYADVAVAAGDDRHLVGRAPAERARIVTP